MTVLMRFAQAGEELQSANEMQIAPLRVLQAREGSVIPHAMIHFQIPKPPCEEPHQCGVVERGINPDCILVDCIRMAL